MVLSLGPAIAVTSLKNKENPRRQAVKRIVLLVLVMFIFFPNESLAFDIIGWWKDDKTKVLIAIDDTKIHGIPYRIISKNDKKITITIDNSPINSFIEPQGEDAFIFINSIGEKSSYHLVTHDVSIPKKELEKN